MSPAIMRAPKTTIPHGMSLGFKSPAWLRSAFLAAVLTLAIPLPVHAAHPLATEDTGTQGEGGFEVELGWQRVREDDVRAMEFGPQLSYGVTDNFDLIVRPTLVEVRVSDA